MNCNEEIQYIDFVNALAPSTRHCGVDAPIIHLYK